jgi:pre-mRNA-processing factor 19
MFCSISGVVPTNPVISKKSGHLYDRTLIEAYIVEKGVCPVTGQPLTKDDLLAVPIAPTAKPRPVATTTVPGLLTTLQVEWDAFMLEHYTLRQHLDTVRLELSKYKYQHEAACRVVTRLTQERDAAREALAESQGGTATGGNNTRARDSKDFTNRATALYDELSQMRRTRTFTKHGTGIIRQYTEAHSVSCHSGTRSGVQCVAISGDSVVTGGADGTAILYGRNSKNVLATYSGHTGPVRRVVSSESQNVFITTSDDGAIRVWPALAPYTPPGAVFRVHAGPVRGLALHPLGDYVFSGGSDSRVGLHSLTAGATVVMAQAADSVNVLQVHPDGNVLAVATSSDVSLIDVRDGTLQTVISTLSQDSGADITAVAFSQNGYTAATGARDGTVTLWDLRRNPPASGEKYTAPGPAVSSLSFESSGILLAVGSGNSVSIVVTKPWGESCVVGTHSAAVEDVCWSDSHRMSSSGAPWLCSVGQDGFLKIFSAQS